MTRLKGPWFPSFNKQHERSSKPQMAWIPNLQMKRQRLKNLRRLCVHALKLDDLPSRAARERLKAAVKDEPEPEYAELHLTAAAWDAHEGTGTPWHEAMTYLLDKFDAAKEDAAATHRATLDSIGV